MPSIDDLIVLENGMGGNITSLSRMNDGRYVITITSINEVKHSFMQGDIDFHTIFVSGRKSNGW